MAIIRTPAAKREEQHKHHQSSYHSGDSISCAKSYLKSAANISSSRRGIKGNKGPKVLSTTKYYTETQISTKSCKKDTIADVFLHKFCLGEILTASLSSP
jgi:hypothetical protein